MQPPPPGFPPQWGSSPHDPRQPSDPAYSHQSPYSGYGSTPAPGQPGPGYGSPAWGGHRPSGSEPTSQQIISWATFAVIGLLGLLGAILTLTLWINLNSAVSHASDVCNRFGGEYANLCRRQIKNSVPGVPPALGTYLMVMISASLVASGGAVLLFFKKQLGVFLLLGGGMVMLVVAVVSEARFGATGRITYDLIAGFVIAAAGAIMLVPAFRIALGMPAKSTSGPGPQGFQGGRHWPSGQPEPPPYGPSAPGGYPPQQW